MAGTSQATVYNPILGLDIGGTLYNVTFHNQAGESFNALWDADDDGVFGGGTSVFSVAPTFWGNEAGVLAARDAIMAFLGTTDQTTGTSDSFFVPWGGSDGGTTLTAGLDFINSAYDNAWSPSIDVPLSLPVMPDWDSAFYYASPYASFEAVVVPLPGALWLFMAAVGGLGLVRRKA